MHTPRRGYFKRLLILNPLLLFVLIPASSGVSRQASKIWPDSESSGPRIKSRAPSSNDLRNGEAASVFPVFDWPLESPLHNGILVGSYFDDDASSNYRDYSGGQHTYDGHNGTDMDVHDLRAMDRGMPVLAAADGVVETAEYSQFDRNTQWRNNAVPNDVLIRHADGGYSWYVHLRKNSITVGVGESVRRGQVIAMVGSSGISSLPHLHFEPGQFSGGRWSPRDPFQGQSQPQESLWRSQEPYVAGTPMRISDIGVFTRAAAGGNISNVPDSSLKERLSQPAVFGTDEPSIGVWVLVQGKARESYTIEVRRPDGSLFNSRTSTLSDYALQDWNYVSWNFSPNVSASDFGTWTARAVIAGAVAAQTSFQVGATSTYGPRFSPVSGRSIRITGAAQQERLTVSSLGGPVTYSLVNAPSSVSLQGDTITIGATSTQSYRSAYFQVVATDAAGRQDTMWYHLVDSSKPFANDSIRATIDGPVEGAVVSGDVAIRGWSAIVGNGRSRKPARVDLYVDDHFAMQLTTGASRTDVQRSLNAEGFAGVADVGFLGTWNARQFSDGPHRLTIRAGDTEEGRFDLLTQTAVTVVVNRNAATGTTTSFTITDRAGVSLITATGTGSPAVGYARIQAGAGSTVPTGFAIFNLRQNNVLVTEASVPAAALMQAGRMYAEVNGPVNTGVAIANSSGQPATISFQFVNSSGTEVRQATTTLQAGTQIAAFLDQAPFNSGAFTGALTFSSPVPVSAIALRGYTNERSEFLITTLPVVPIDAASSDTLLLPHLADGGGWTTQIVLINSSSQAMTGALEFFTQGTSTEAGRAWSVVMDGQSGNRFTYSLPARSARALKTSGTGSSTVVGWARIVPSGSSASPAGSALFSYKPANVTVSETSAAAMRSGSAFRMYVESSGNFSASAPGSIESGLAIANPNANAATVNYELTKLDGTATGLSGSLTVPATGQIATFLRQLPPLAGLQTPFQGILRISSSSTIATVGLRSRYNERTDFLLATTPPSNESTPGTSQEISFPHLVFDGGYTTQFILFSGTPNVAEGSLSFFSQAGQPLAVPIRP